MHCSGHDVAACRKHCSVYKELEQAVSTGEAKTARSAATLHRYIVLPHVVCFKQTHTHICADQAMLGSEGRTRMQPFAVALTARRLHDWPGAGALRSECGGAAGAAAAGLGRGAASAARMTAPALAGRAARKLVTCAAVRREATAPPRVQ